MELAGGLLVLFVVAFLVLTICAGGLCADGKEIRAAKKEIKR